MDHELYADWAYQLNIFAIENADEVDPLKIPLEQAREFFAEYAIPDDEYSILFMKRDQPALYHAGAILDSDVYLAVLTFYTERYLPELLEHHQAQNIDEFMHQLSLKKINYKNRVQ